MVATNAGGLHVIRYGAMRAQVVGVEAVFANGQVVSRMSGLVKDNSGYDLAGLLCGSEGTLAIVTAARLRLVPRSTHRIAALLGCADIDAALSILARVRHLGSLEALEVMFSDGVELVRRHTGLPPPFSRQHPCLLLVECAGEVDPTDELTGVLASSPEILDSALASDGPSRARLWAWRERHTEAVNAIGVPHKLDVTLPLGALASFVADLDPLVQGVAPGARLVIWGHLGDGNLHVNVVGPDPDDATVDEAVLRLVAARDGSISAEHGIGVAKLAWLGMTRSPSDLAVMASIKRALDPDGLLNPGVILPRAGR
jgi:FAD/FMN-containing dehydrogenase